MRALSFLSQSRSAGVDMVDSRGGEKGGKSWKRICLIMTTSPSPSSSSWRGQASPAGRQGWIPPHRETHGGGWNVHRPLSISLSLSLSRVSPFFLTHYLQVRLNENKRARAMRMQNERKGEKKQFIKSKNICRPFFTWCTYTHACHGRVQRSQWVVESLRCSSNP